MKLIMSVSPSTGFLAIPYPHERHCVSTTLALHENVRHGSSDCELGGKICTAYPCIMQVPGSVGYTVGCCLFSDETEELLLFLYDFVLQVMNEHDAMIKRPIKLIFLFE
jgi:hypothetical protein